MNSFTIGFGIFTVIFLISALIVDRNSSKIIGFAGEFWVRKELNKLPDEYLFLKQDTKLKKEEPLHWYKLKMIFSHKKFYQKNIFVLREQQKILKLKLKILLVIFFV